MGQQPFANKHATTPCSASEKGRHLWRFHRFLSCCLLYT